MIWGFTLKISAYKMYTFKPNHKFGYFVLDACFPASPNLEFPKMKSSLLLSGTHVEVFSDERTECLEFSLK